MIPAVAAALLNNGFGGLAHVTAKRGALADDLRKATAFVASHIPLMCAGIDQLTWSGCSSCHLKLLQ